MEINYLFVGVVVFLIISAVRGYSKGFLRIAITLVGLVSIIMLVTVLSPYVSSFLIEKTPIYEKVRENVDQIFLSQNDKDAKNGQEEAIKEYGLPELITAAIIENNTEEKYNELAVSIFEEYVAGYISRMIIKAGTFIALVAFFWIVLWILLFISDFLGKIPVLRTFNRLMGLGAGLTTGVLIVWLAFLVVVAFLGGDLSLLMLDEIKKSTFLTFLFNNNQIFKFIK